MLDIMLRSALQVQGRSAIKATVGPCHYCSLASEICGRWVEGLVESPAECIEH